MNSQNVGAIWLRKRGKGPEAVRDACLISRNVNAATPTAAVRRSSRDALDLGAIEIVSKVDGVLDQKPRRLRDRTTKVSKNSRGFKVHCVKKSILATAAGRVATETVAGN